MKKQHTIGIVITLCAFFLGSCQNALSDILLRTTDDPFQDVARAESFKKTNTIYLSWKADEGTDEFVLMRSDDIAIPVFSVVYRGTESAYTERFTSMMITNDRFLYRLDKMRGPKIFYGEKYTYAVRSGSLLSDAYEYNDTKETATYLEGDCIATMPCYKFTDETLLVDEDWYYVRVPPRRTAFIVLSETGITGTHITHFRYLIDNSGIDAAISNATAFGIENTGYETRILRFKIYADMAQVLISPEYSSGSAPLSYKISLSKIQ